MNLKITLMKVQKRIGKVVKAMVEEEEYFLIQCLKVLLIILVMGCLQKMHLF